MKVRKTKACGTKLWNVAAACMCEKRDTESDSECAGGVNCADSSVCGACADLSCLISVCELCGCVRGAGGFGDVVGM